MHHELSALAEQLEAFAQARDWKQFHSPKNLAAALTVEAAELLEHFQWLSEQQSASLPEAIKADVANEMADVLLYLVQLASALNIDLLDAAQKKITINEAKYPVEKAKGSSKKYNRLNEGASRK